MDNNFTDQAHIQRIREALWRGREFGRATVMVGAGFSLNSVKVSPSVPQFPTWSMLAEALVDGLHPRITRADEDRESALHRTLSTSGALRVAEEYEAAFGRDALESFLLTHIPDAAYEPGDLHARLLSLPWADVLTTNYDTLLERSAEGAVDRRYDVVRIASDIPSTSRPRIVKLHGSFPSTRPFIFTEEDFRTYPRKFAPFVNLAQQAAMESVLCLIGFSGDDPNFLYWTGWVRDNLGRHSPQIYLCGLLNLNTARRNLLHDRNVVPVDLSPLFSRERWPNISSRYYKATEWLIANLEAGKPPPIKAWPDLTRSVAIVASSDLPLLVESAHTTPLPEEPFPRNGVSSVDAIAEVGRCWAFNRALYPGWVVAPKDTRDTLWRSTEYWVGPVVQHAATISARERIKLLNELSWRIERCLLPLTRDLDQVTKAALEDFCPFPDVPSLSNSFSDLRFGDGINVEWALLRDAWASLAIRLLRSAREDRGDAEFAKWKECLRLLEGKLPEVHNFISHESALFALENLDLDGVRDAVNRWRVTAADPFWLIRRASILAEIGDTDQATREADLALKLIRQRTRESENDIAMLSREGWAMLLVRALSHSRMPGDDPRPEFRGRWERLSEFNCNPNADLDLIDAQLEQPAPQPKPSSTEILNVDGSISRQLHFASGVEKKLLPAYQLLRLVEDAGYPTKCGNLIISQRAVLDASRWIANHSPSIALGALFRASEADSVAKFFDASRVALLPPEQAKEIRGRAVKLLHRSISSLGSDTSDLISGAQKYTAIEHAKLGFVLLGRLSLTESEAGLADALKLAVGLYSAPGLRRAVSLADRYKEFVEGLLSIVPESAVGNELLGLASLPIPGFEGFDVVVPELWVDPLSLIRGRDRSLPRKGDPDGWARAVDFLIRASGTDVPIARVRAVVRLSVLFANRFLSAKEASRFGDVLWSKRNSDTGLPLDTGMNDHAFLKLPHPTRIDPRRMFKKLYLRRKLDPLIEKIKLPDGRDGERSTFGMSKGLVLDVIDGATARKATDGIKKERLIDWTQAEAGALLAIAEQWWRDEGKQITSNKKALSQPLFPDSFAARVTSILSMVANVVIPRARRGGELAARTLALVDDVISCSNVPTEFMLPALLPLQPSRASKIAASLRKGLVSPNPDIVRSAMAGVYRWLTMQAAMQIRHAPADLSHELGRIVSGRIAPGLPFALAYIRRIATDVPSALDAATVASALVGLQYLFEETKYSVQSMGPTSDGHLDTAALRVSAARTAYAISKAYQAPEADALVKEAASDALTPVRTASIGGEVTMT